MAQGGQNGINPALLAVLASAGRGGGLDNPAILAALTGGFGGGDGGSNNAALMALIASSQGGGGGFSPAVLAALVAGGDQSKADDASWPLILAAIASRAGPAEPEPAGGGSESQLLQQAEAELRQARQRLDEEQKSRPMPPEVLQLVFKAAEATGQALDCVQQAMAAVEGEKVLTIMPVSRPDGPGSKP